MIFFKDLKKLIIYPKADKRIFENHDRDIEILKAIRVPAEMTKIGREIIDKWGGADLALYYAEIDDIEIDRFLYKYI